MEEYDADGDGRLDEEEIAAMEQRFSAESGVTVQAPVSAGGEGSLLVAAEPTEAAPAAVHSAPPKKTSLLAPVEAATPDAVQVAPPRKTSPLLAPVEAAAPQEAVHSAAPPQLVDALQAAKAAGASAAEAAGPALAAAAEAATPALQVATEAATEAASAAVVAAGILEDENGDGKIDQADAKIAIERTAKLAK